MTRRVVGIVAAAAVALLLLAFGSALVPARGDAPDKLSVYAGRGIASPIGVVSRVPAESAGGVIYSESRLEIGKTRAIAAGMTLGELAEAFLITSIQGYTNPTLVNAQYPPSNVYKSDQSFSNGVSSGGQSVIDIHAVADGSPSAKANAIGGAGAIPGALHIGGGTSRSQSLVKDDGTVVTTAVSSVHDVTIGPDLAPVLTIGTMTSTASVEVPFGGKPKTSLTVQMSGALVSGTPVTITQDGITIANSAAVPASSVQQVNQSLAQLDQYGISVRAVPVDKQVTDTEGTVSGAALQFRYTVPPTVSLPTDIGKDETFLLGQVIANAAGRPRQPVSLGTPAAEVSGSGASSTELPLGAEPVATTPELSLPAAQPAALGGPSAAAPAPAAGPPPFQLARRARNVVADRVLSGYRLIILVAVIAAAVYVLRNRTRLPE
ncbi:MAG: hypothetical protein E6G57_16075 [Actinobacteria bacterium]|nr:MAG: hypothetical protein E6G57_16075 [Actinomycetota bacterium]